MKIASSGREFYDDGYSDGEDEEKQGLENRLIFPNKYYGKDEHLRLLESLYSVLSSREEEVDGYHIGLSSMSSEPPFVVLSGYSGSGKSTIVNHFIRTLDKKSKLGKVKPFLFLSGKYDKRSNSNTNNNNNRSEVQPCSAIIQAFDKFGLQLLQDGNEEELEMTRVFIKAAIGDDIKSLVSLVPGLKDVLLEQVIGEEDNGDDDGDDGGNGDENDPTSRDWSSKTSPKENDISSKNNAWNRLRYLFQCLLNSISCPDKPVILFLDDLQWADDSSLDLLSVFLRDKKLRHIMIIVSVSAMPVKDANDPIIQFLEKVEEHRSIDWIDVKNLSLAEMNTFVAETLKLQEDTDETLALSKVIHGKSNGNLLFAMNILEELHRKNALFFSVITFSWEWDLKSAQKLDVDPSDGIISIIQDKIREAPELLQRVLVLASYTRSTFSKTLLQSLLEADQGRQSPDEFAKILEQAVRTGLLSIRHSSKEETYRFAHDQIQEAARSLTPAGPERDTLMLLLAQRLFDLSRTDKGGNWMLFTSANHINSMASCENLDPIFLVTLNLHCGEKAVEYGAFAAAERYLRKGISTLQMIEAPWKTQYSLTLQLYRATSEVDTCLGKNDQGTDLCKEILKHCKTLQEKMPTYLVLAITKGKLGLHHESMRIALSALELNGVIPKHFLIVHFLKDLQKVKKYFMENGDAVFLAIPFMVAPENLIAMELLKEAMVRAYASQNMLVFMLCNLRSILLGIENGLCSAVASGLAGYGIYLSSKGDQTGAARIGSLVNDVLNLAKDKKSQGIAIYAVTSFLDGWSNPKLSTLQAYQKGQIASMEAGDTAYAFFNGILAFRCALYGGFSLDSLVANGNEIMEQMQLYNDQYCILAMNQSLSLVKQLNMSSRDIDWERVGKPDFDTKDKNNQHVLLQFYLSKIMLGLLFGNLEFAKAGVDRVVGINRRDTQYLNLTLRNFLSGLTYSRLARVTKKKKHIRRSRHYAKKLKQLVASKGPNPIAHLKLMEADLLACTSQDMTEIHESYHNAILLAKDKGYIHIVSLGYEIAGEFFLKNKRAKVATEYIRNAHASYTDWCAYAKVDDLEKKYPIFFTTDGKVNSPKNGQRVMKRVSIDVNLLSVHKPRDMSFFSKNSFIVE